MLAIQWVALHPLIFWGCCVITAIAVWVFVLRKQLEWNFARKIWKFTLRIIEATGASVSGFIGAFGGWISAILLNLFITYLLIKFIIEVIEGMLAN